MNTNSLFPEPLTLNGNFQLGHLPKGFSEVRELLTQPSKPHSPSRDAEIVIDASWFDLTLLAAFSQLIRSGSQKFHSLSLKFPSLTPRKMMFLWEVGFWSHIQANRHRSPVVSIPDPWRHQPKPDAAPSNYTPILRYDITEPSDDVKQYVLELENHLKATAVYPYIRTTDVIESREYLFLLLWELIHNAYRHSAGTSLALTAQVFCGPDLDSSGPASSQETLQPLSEQLRNHLHAQFVDERRRSALSDRSRWFKRHSTATFLAISVVDNGGGIPSRLRLQKKIDTSSDSAALKAAFNPAMSDRMNDPSLFDVHGLSQVDRLVKEYDGYLYAQSGNARIQSSVTGERVEDITPNEVLPGTLFHILLPLHSTVKRRKPFSPSLAPASSTEQQGTVLPVYHTLTAKRLGQIEHPDDWHMLIRPLVEKANSASTPQFLVDLSCMPRRRQFTSYLLRCLRKVRLFRGMVVVNASDALFGVAKSLQRLDSGTEISAEDKKHIEDLDIELSTILPRGEVGWCLPLLLPFSTIDAPTGKPKLLWLGLTGIRQEFRQPFQDALDHLYVIEQEASWDDLWQHVNRLHSDSKLSEAEFIRGFRAMCRCNPTLLGVSNRGVAIQLTERHMYDASHQALREIFIYSVLKKAKHPKKTTQQDYLYYFSWRQKEPRFRKAYYETWRILSDETTLSLSLDLLVRTAYAHLGERLNCVQAIISITPSAGLLGRKLAQMLDVEFWEVPSFYDMEDPDALPDLRGMRLLVIDDVIDTGFSTNRILDRLASSDCIAVLTLLRSVEGLQLPKNAKGVPLIAACNVNLGTASESEVKKAREQGTYFEIDPHTLEAVPPNAFSQSTPPKETAHAKAQAIGALANGRCLFHGHFIFAEHHYTLYFSLRHLLLAPGLKEEALSWIKNRVAAAASDKGHPSVIVVFPYYSPISLIVEVLRTESFFKDGVKMQVQFAVAKPIQRSRKRLGYSLEMLGGPYTNGPLRDYVFLDDAVSSGGTLASILETIIPKRPRSLHAVVLFDRIGLHPRRHLRNIQSYRSLTPGGIPFTYESWITVNLGTYFREDCPLCRVTRALSDLQLRSGILPQLVPHLINQLRPTHVGYYKADLQSALSSQDVATIMGFQDAVYSDLPSSREIGKSLDAPQKSGNAKLEMLTTLLLDRKLSRQIADFGVRNHHIDGAFAKADSNGRTRFISQIPFWHEATSYGYEFLTATLPRIYERITRDSMTTKSQVGAHFSKYGLEFASSASALLQLSRRTRPDVSTALSEWRRVLRAQDKDAIYGNPYLFELWTLLTENRDAGVGQARFLINNFIGTYTEHKDSLRARITWCFQFAESDTTTAREQIPESLLGAMIDAIAVTENTFGLVHGHINEDERAALQNEYRAWVKGSSAENLLALFDTLLVSGDPTARPARIETMLAQITPAVSGLLLDAKAQYEQDVPTDVVKAVEIRQEYNVAEWAKVHALGTDVVLVRTLAHLVQNAIQHRCGKSYKKQPPSGLMIEIRVASPRSTGNGEEIILISVVDNNPDMTLEACKSTFQQTGGLSAQQKALAPWGGTLDVEKLPDGRTSFFVKLLRCDPLDTNRRTEYE